MTRPLSYQQAYHREQIKGRFWFAGWLLAAFFGMWVPSFGWRVVWYWIVFLWILGLFKHYDQDAIRYRATLRANSEKPLL